MFRNKFNRKFKRVLALSMLGTFCCSHCVMEADKIHLLDLNLAGRNDLFDLRIWTTTEKTIKLQNGESIKYSFAKTSRGYNVTTGVEYFAGTYNDDKTEAVDIMFIKANDAIIMIPYDPTIYNLLPKYYNKLNDEYKLPDKESKWWDSTESCKKYLEDLDKQNQEKKEKDLEDEGKKPDDTLLDDIKRYLGLKSRWQVLALIAVGAVVIIGGTVWVTKSLLRSVGDAGSAIIHGNKEDTRVQIPVAVVPQQPSIIINTK